MDRHPTPLRARMPAVEKKEGQTLDDDQGGPPWLPGGKFRMTLEGNERLLMKHAVRWAKGHRVVCETVPSRTP